MNKVRAGLVVFLFLSMVVFAAVWQGCSVKFKCRRRKTFPQKFHKVWCRLFRIRVRTIGKPAGGGVLLVANHQSYLDIPVMGSTSRFAFVSRHDIANWPVVGTMVRLQESVLVERKKRGKVGEQMDAIRDRLEQGESVAIFAEGTTSAGNGVKTFKSSLLAAAVGDGSDGPSGKVYTVQPVSIAYVGHHGLPIGYEDRDHCAWIGDADLVPHVWNILKGGPIDAIVQYHEPIRFAPGDRKTAAQMAEKIVRAGLLHAPALWRGAAA